MGWCSLKINSLLCCLCIMFTFMHMIMPPNHKLLWLGRKKLSGSGWDGANFTAAHIVLCFGFVTKTVLVTHRCFSYCQIVIAQHQGLLCFSLCTPGSRLGVHKKCGGTQPGQLTWMDHRDILHHITLWSVIKLGESSQGSHCFYFKSIILITSSKLYFL